MSAANAEVPGSGPVGVVGAVLHQVAARLAALGRDPSCEDYIDVNSLPMTDADREGLRDFLGRGEVDADCDVAGRCHVRETRFSGVWWVAYLSENGVPLLEQIVIARIPALLMAHPDDILAAHRMLGERLAGTGLDRDPTGQD
jgi:hydrogenase-1 operon protein HyaF